MLLQEKLKYAASVIEPRRKAIEERKKAINEHKNAIEEKETF